MTRTDTTSDGYTIGDAARLSGFAPTALRYYEDAGILAPSARTAAGYRIYDDRDLDRLRLIRRAKQLGCTLDEVRDLLEAWDDEQCGPVKHRLRSLVDEKVAAVQEHLADQLALASQLQATSALLAERPLDGPCDDSCGCATTTAAIESAPRRGDADQSVPVPFGRRSSETSEETAIACSLPAGEMGTRFQDWQRVLDSVIDRQPLAGGLRLMLDDDAPLGDIARLAAAEHQCCSFFGFSLTVDRRGAALEVTAPEDGQDVLVAAFGSAS
ncbi:MAG: MerR family transcriptional regulator [Acidimicrobiales bacterium]|nr:MerR family transcriptional regulator [Acidimicrobiales bacterium]